MYVMGKESYLVRQCTIYICLNQVGRDPKTCCMVSFYAYTYAHMYVDSHTVHIRTVLY